MNWAKLPFRSFVPSYRTTHRAWRLELYNEHVTFKKLTGEMLSYELIELIGESLLLVL